MTSSVPEQFCDWLRHAKKIPAVLWPTLSERERRELAMEFYGRTEAVVVKSRFAEPKPVENRVRFKESSSVSGESNIIGKDRTESASSMRVQGAVRRRTDANVVLGADAVRAREPGSSALRVGAGEIRAGVSRGALRVTGTGAGSGASESGAPGARVGTGVPVASVGAGVLRGTGSGAGGGMAYTISKKIMETFSESLLFEDYGKSGVIIYWCDIDSDYLWRQASSTNAHIRVINLFVNKIENNKPFFEFLQTNSRNYSEVLTFLATSKKSKTFPEAPLNLIAFKNQTFVFKPQKQPVRTEIFRDDKILKNATTRYAWIYLDPKYGTMVTECFGRLFDNTEIYEYLLNMLTLQLSKASAAHKNFFILIGGGQNGKTLLFSIMKAAMGLYYMSDFSDQVLTANPKADKPQPERIKFMNTRVALFSDYGSEEGKKKLSTTFLKKITGNDPVSLRQMYKASSKIYPNPPTVWISANDPPKIDKLKQNDISLARRVRVLHFEKTFSKGSEGYIDYSEKDIQSMGHALMNIMIDRWQTLPVQIPVPDEVVTWSAEWLAENSHTSDIDFWKEKIKSIPPAEEADGVEEAKDGDHY